MKEFIKSKNGKIIVGVIALVILVAIVLLISKINSSDNEGQKPGDITNEKEIKNPNGLQIGDSLDESEDTLSVSEENSEGETSVEEPSTGNISNQEELSEGDDNVSDEEPKEDTEEGEQPTTSEDTFGELY